MLTICLKFGVVPSSFRTGVLVPILKKSGCDAAVPKNWRPVVISLTLSKLLEVYILDAVSGHDFDELQFGFLIIIIIGFIHHFLRGVLNQDLKAEELTWRQHFSETSYLNLQIEAVQCTPTHLTQ